MEAKDGYHIVEILLDDIALSGAAFDQALTEGLTVDHLSDHSILVRSEANMTISAIPVEKVYNAANFGLTDNDFIIANKPEREVTILYSTNNADWSEVSPEYSTVGTYPVYVKATDGIYETPALETSIKITQRPVEITLQGVEVVYDGDEHSVAYSVEEMGDPFDPIMKDRGLMKGHNLDIEFVNDNQTNAGTYEVTVDNIKIEDATPNDVLSNYEVQYHEEVDKVQILIHPRDITITAATAQKTYDGTPLIAQSANVTSGTIVEGQKISSITVQGSQTAVGSSSNIASNAIITAPNDGEEIDVTTNYNITYLPGTLTVTTSGGGGTGPGGGGGPSGNTEGNNRYTPPTGGPGTTTITPEDVPLAPLPESPVDVTLIDDGEVPLAPLPKTGQTSMRTTLTMMLSGIFVAVTALSKKRKEEDS